MAKRKPLNVSPGEETWVPGLVADKENSQTARKGQVTLVTYTDPAVKKHRMLSSGANAEAHSCL